jgi:hypothetical protein
VAVFQLYLLSRQKKTGKDKRKHWRENPFNIFIHVKLLFIGIWAKMTLHILYISVYFVKFIIDPVKAVLPAG